MKKGGLPLSRFVCVGDTVIGSGWLGSLWKRDSPKTFPLPRQYNLHNALLTREKKRLEAQTSFQPLRVKEIEGYGETSA